MEFQGHLTTQCPHKDSQVSCQLEELAGLQMYSTKGQLKKALRSLPRTLGGTYECILNCIPQHQWEYVFQVLKWLTFSKRCLICWELAAALEVDVEGAAPVKGDNEVPVLQAMLNMCSSLVTITPEHVDKDDVHVQLEHLSVQSYLTSEQIKLGKVKHFSFSAKSTHTLISWTCLFVLLQLHNTESWESIANLNSPLDLYSPNYWIQHVLSEDTASSTELEQPMRALFQLQSMPYTNLIQLHDIDRPWNPPQLRCSLGTIPPLLYYVSCAGL